MENQSKIYRKINNFHWDKEYEDIYNYIQTNKIPGWIKTDNQLKKFQERYKLFDIKDGFIYLPYYDLLVIPDNKKLEIMDEFYKDLVNSSVGIKSFYKKICIKYLNIKRKDCSEFLKNQTYYQLTKPIIHKTNKPLLPTKINELWAIDLIDMNPYVAQNIGST